MLSLLLIAGCTWIPADYDDDGFDVGDDCDDRDPEQGLVRSFFRDDDGDGYGTATATTTRDACTHPGVGWAERGGDCDDTDALVHPGAEERCNRVDDDCDGTVPESERDGDSDGVSTCEGDCDDANADATTITQGFVDIDGDGAPGTAPWRAARPPRRRTATTPMPTWDPSPKRSATGATTTATTWWTTTTPGWWRRPPSSMPMVTATPAPRWCRRASTSRRYRRATATTPIQKRTRARWSAATSSTTTATVSWTTRGTSFRKMRLPGTRTTTGMASAR